jgi:hypothetical protein
MVEMVEVVETVQRMKMVQMEEIVEMVFRNSISDLQSPRVCTIGIEKFYFGGRGAVLVNASTLGKD